MLSRVARLIVVTAILLGLGLTTVQGVEGGHKKPPKKPTPVSQCKKPVKKHYGKYPKKRNCDRPSKDDNPKKDTPKWVIIITEKDTEFTGGQGGDATSGDATGGNGGNGGDGGDAYGGDATANGGNATGGSATGGSATSHKGDAYGGDAYGGDAYGGDGGYAEGGAATGGAGGDGGAGGSATSGDATGGDGGDVSAVYCKYYDCD